MSFEVHDAAGRIKMLSQMDSRMLNTLACFRLSAQSGTPVPTTNQTAVTSLYVAPFGGNVVGLYSSNVWVTRTFSELTLSLSSLERHRMYDVFLYDNAGSVAVEALGWTAPTTGTITGVTNASPPVVTATNSLAAGDIVTIHGVLGATGANGTFRVASPSGSAFTLNTLAGGNPAAPGAYTSGGTFVKANYTGSRATALAWQDGILVKSGDPTRRYIGTFCITATLGQTEDSTTSRFVWNYYNRRLRQMFREFTTSHGYTTATWRAVNNDLAQRVDFVVGVQEDSVTGSMLHQSTNSAETGLGLDTITGVSLWTNAPNILSGTTVGRWVSALNFAPIAAGKHYFSLNELGATSGNVNRVGVSALMWM
jgi:hypothetical protein